MTATKVLDDTAVALMALGDDDLAVGHILTSVAGFGPELELDIAMSSMGQDELGHARSYYSLAVGTDRDAINGAIFHREAADFAASPLSWLYAEAWEHLVVKQFLFETADAERRQALRTSPLAELVETVARMEGEEQYHVEFWTVWLERAAGRDAASAARVQGALDALWGHAAALFDVPGAGELLGGGDELGSAARRWTASATAALVEMGLVVPAGAAPRLREGGQERVLEELHYVHRATPGNW